MSGDHSCRSLRVRGILRHIVSRRPKYGCILDLLGGFLDDVLIDLRGDGRYDGADRNADHRTCQAYLGSKEERGHRRKGAGKHLGQ